MNSSQGDKSMTSENGNHVSDQTILERMNQEYVAAFMNSNVEWYQEHLAEDFICIESNGVIVHKQKFLANNAKGPDVADYKLEQVDVRVYGDAALVQATGLWTRRDGSKGMSRYIDVYVRHDCEWKTVSAQITRTGSIGPRGPYKRPK
jgi:ketosteroid isomerase-like protein